MEVIVDSALYGEYIVNVHVYECFMVHIAGGTCFSSVEWGKSAIH